MTKPDKRLTTALFYFAVVIGIGDSLTAAAYLLTQPDQWRVSALALVSLLQFGFCYLIARRRPRSATSEELGRSNRS